jgi:1,4-dihydroxy-2-naphthoate octaprenyltransferase
MAILVVNNTRDIDTDKKVNKKTISVRLGKILSKFYYEFLIILSFLGLLHLLIDTRSFFLLAFVNRVVKRKGRYVD